ncbi:MAG: zinc-binding dehydrogenase [Crocinitomicaceae bacterium]|nr:zinc-binding dehydrogenase [Crocinitomicaceae bacterium]
MQTEAFYLYRVGNADKAFEKRPLTLSSPTDKEVMIEVEAFGLNYADVMARRGLYNEAPTMPCVIGYEVVGKVVECGPKADQSLQGKRVAAFCRFGGYAKHIKTNDNAVVEVGDQDAAELLALCTQGVTAYYMARYLAPIHESDTVLIHAAAGGVGTILIQLAKLNGAEVIAKIGRKEKSNLVKDLGADFVVNYNTSDYIEQINRYLNGDRIDVSYNPVAGSTFKKDMSILGSGARMVLFGGSELSKGKWGIFSKLNFVRKMGLVLPIGLMMRSKNILGVNMLKIADNKPRVLETCLKEIVALYKSGKIKPQIGGVYSSNNLAEAHAALESGGTTGKLAIVWEKE